MSEPNSELRGDELALDEPTLELLKPEELEAVGGGAFPFIQTA